MRIGFLRQDISKVSRFYLRGFCLQVQCLHGLSDMEAVHKVRLLQNDSALRAYGADAQERIVSELDTRLRVNRSIQSEEAFGAPGQHGGFRRFPRRGPAHVFTEVLLHLFAFNIAKPDSIMQTNGCCHPLPAQGLLATRKLNPFPCEFCLCFLSQSNVFSEGYSPKYSGVSTAEINFEYE